LGFDHRQPSLPGRTRSPPGGEDRAVAGETL